MAVLYLDKQSVGRRLAASGMEISGLAIGGAWTSSVGPCQKTQAMPSQLLILIILLLGCAASGCSLIENAAHTLVIQPLHYCAHKDKYSSHHRHRQMAKDAWESIEAGAPRCTYSFDYGVGFREGYADFLDAGPGNTPALPPRRYWKGRYQTPTGHQAILDWYQGFRHGANVAAESGWRQFVTLPSPLSVEPAHLHTAPQAISTPPAELIPTPPPSQLIDPPPSALEPADSGLRLLEEGGSDVLPVPLQPSINPPSSWPSNAPGGIPTPSVPPPSVPSPSLPPPSVPPES